MTPLDVLIRIGIAIIIGGAVGWERESCNRPAGFRTHTLVCISSAIVMMTGLFLMGKYGDYTTLAPSYIAAAVLSGIGFLGAGTILRSGTKVKGLTTAASLWTVAGLGLAVGGGFYEGALIGVVVVLLTLTVLEGTAKKFALGSKRFHAHLIFTCCDPISTLKEVEKWLDLNQVEIRVISIHGDEHHVFKVEGRLESRKAGSHISYMFVGTSLPAVAGVLTVKVSEN